MTKSDEEDIFVPSGEDSKGYNMLLKADNELYNEEDNVPAPVVSVRRVKLPRSGEDWEILVNGKVALVMKGTRFTNPEKEFLRTVDGMRFLISEYKEGRKSVVKIKEQMKRAMK